MSEVLTLDHLKQVLNEARKRAGMPQPNALSVLAHEVAVTHCQSAIYYAEHSSFVADADGKSISDLYHNLKELKAENEALKNRENTTYLADDNDKLRALLLSIASSQAWPCNFWSVTNENWTCSLKDEMCGVCKAAVHFGLKLTKGRYNPKEADGE